MLKISNFEKSVRFIPFKKKLVKNLYNINKTFKRSNELRKKELFQFAEIYLKKFSES